MAVEVGNLEQVVPDTGKRIDYVYQIVRGMSQVEFLEKLAGVGYRVSQPMLSQLISGKRRRSAGFVRAAALVLGVSADWLLCLPGASMQRPIPASAAAQRIARLVDAAPVSRRQEIEAIVATLASGAQTPGLGNHVDNNAVDAWTEFLREEYADSPARAEKIMQMLEELNPALARAVRRKLDDLGIDLRSQFVA
jgi:transcriptional regulator with XRE-family HTH domain